MPEIGMTMLEEAASRLDRQVDFVATHHRPDRLVTGTQPLGDGKDIGPHAIRFTSEHMASPAHAAHHLVKDQQHAVPVADLADAGEIAIKGRHRAKRRTDHRLGHERHDIPCTQPQDFRF